MKEVYIFREQLSIEKQRELKTALIRYLLGQSVKTDNFRAIIPWTPGIYKKESTKITFRILSDFLQIQKNIFEQEPTWDIEKLVSPNKNDDTDISTNEYREGFDRFVTETLDGLCQRYQHLVNKINLQLQLKKIQGNTLGKNPSSVKYIDDLLANGELAKVCAYLEIMSIPSNRTLDTSLLDTYPFLDTCSPFFDTPRPPVRILEGEPVSLVDALPWGVSTGAAYDRSL